MPASPPAASPSPISTRTPTTSGSIAIPRATSSARITGQKLTFFPIQDFPPEHNAFLRVEIDEYCTLQGWTCDQSSASGQGDLLAALIAAMQAGYTLDAFCLDINVPRYYFSGVLEKVTDLVGELGARHGPFPPGFEHTTVIDDEWWGVPFYVRAGGLYARRDLFARHGLDLVRDTETYDQLREAALRITDASKQLRGWGLPVSRTGEGNTTVQQILLRFGSQLQDASGQFVTFSSPETIAGLRWLQETYTDPLWAPMLPPGFVNWIAPSNNEAFLDGRLGLTENLGTIYSKAVLDNLPLADDIALVPRPKRATDGQRLDALAGMRLHIGKGSKNREATYDLFRHLLSEPVIKRLLAISPGYVLPPYRSLWNAPLVRANANARSAEAMVYPSAPFTGLRHPGPISAAIDAIENGNFYADMLAALLGGRPADEVARDYHRGFIQIFRSFGLAGA